MIARPDQYVGVTTYSGNSLKNDIRLGFAPDMIWLKSRTNTTYSALSDTLSGAYYFLTPTNTDISSYGYNDDIVSFDKYGFTFIQHGQSTKRVKTMLEYLEMVEIKTPLMSMM